MSNATDAEKLKELVCKQAERTGSAKAKDLMRDPPSIPGKFRKVVPKPDEEAPKKKK